MIDLGDDVGLIKADLRYEGFGTVSSVLQEH